MRRPIQLFLLFAAIGFGVVSSAANQEPTAPSPPTPPLPLPAPTSPVPWIGVWLTDSVDGGVRIERLAPRGPAQRADLRVGDVIVRAGATDVTLRPTLSGVLATTEPGKQLDVAVLRGGQLVVAQVEVGDRQYIDCPEPGSPCTRQPVVYWPRSPMRFGAELVEITPELREHYGAPGGIGLMVVRTREGGLADSAGLRVGDILVRIGETDLSDSRQLQSVLLTWDREEPMELRLVRDREMIALQMVLPSQEQQEQGRLRRRLESQIEMLEKRLEQLRDELESIDPE